MSKFILNEAESQTALWQKIKKHLEQRLETARNKNDGDLNEVETAKLRGRITELKSFLALDKPPPILTGNESQDPFPEY
jgi:GTP1/Obg family GTP-binding protein